MFSIKLTRRQIRKLITLPSKSPRYFTRKRRRKLRRHGHRPLRAAETLVSMETVIDPATGLRFQRSRYADGKESWDLCYGIGSNGTIVQAVDN